MEPSFALVRGQLVRRRDAGGGLVLHELETPAHLARTYVSPGQYVSLALHGKDTYFALAGEPLAATWEVLVRAGGDVADALLDLPLGGHVDLSPALGAGFPMAEAAGRRLFVVATGSGIAAVRPVVRARARAGLAGATEVFLGVRVRADVPLAEELEERTALGMAVTVCCSREGPSGDGPGPRVRSGYVQDVLQSRAVDEPASVPGAIVFAAGVTAMITHLRQLARELHIPEADVRTNY